MGYDKFTYVGPYVKIDCEEYTDFRDFCEDSINNKLCTAWTANDIMFGGFAYLMPNQKEKSPRKMFIEVDYSFSEDNNLNPTEEKEWLTKTFQKELEKLQSTYPNFVISIEWGILTFAH